MSESNSKYYFSNRENSRYRDVLIDELSNELSHRGYSRSYCRGKLISNKSDYFNRENLSIIDRIHLVVEQNVREFSVVEDQYDIKRLFSKYKWV